MSDLCIREYEKRDHAALTRLWAETFGDDEALISAFLRLLPEMGGCVAAEREGRIVGAAYLITGMELASPAGEKQLLGYLYAVAVEPAARGRGVGAALSRAAFDWGRARGAQILCTQPAEPRLFDWYGEVLGVRCALRRRVETYSSAALEPCMELSCTDYRFWRERMLQERPHIRLGDAALSFQQLLCRSYGGGFFAVGDGVAAATLENGRCVVRELLCPDEAGRRALAASLGAQLGAAETLLYTPDPDGEPYIAAPDGALPPDCVWNLSFD